MSDQILNPQGLPSDFSKSPQDLADEINNRLGPNATPEQVEAEVARVNAGAQAAAKLAAGVPIEEIGEENPVYQFTQHFYAILTPQLRAILSSGIDIRAVLSCTDPANGTLQLDIHPAKVVSRIDDEQKRVILAVGPDGKSIDPDELAKPDPKDGQVTSEECESGCGCDTGCDRN